MNIDRNTVSVITGAASGIGRATALRLAQQGSALAISDVNAKGLQETTEAASAFGVKVTPFVMDVADKEAMRAFADEVARQHGRASILLNNAGVALWGTADELSLEDYEWLMGINFWGVVYGTKMFLPLLKQQPEAYILNVSSIFGIIAPVGHSAYVASKFAVRGFTESLRHELHGTNVRVATIHPGGIKTNIAVNAKVGAGATADGHKDGAAKFDKVAATTPEKAAETIVQGILKNKRRIMIGADARALALLQRCVPVNYWRVLGPWFEKQLGT
ncbi:MAG TPA: SDR family NAD(P)-dependent oxidoreductase [Blastocatellia bacterium]|nr:SDR family NAD(P)-dependent oxidoreductase [Blastocatellia bacterium]